MVQGNAMLVRRLRGAMVQGGGTAGRIVSPVSPPRCACQLLHLEGKPQRHRTTSVITAKNRGTVDVRLEVLLRASVGTAIHQSARVVDALRYSLPGPVYGVP